MFKKNSSHRYFSSAPFSNKGEITHFLPHYQSLTKTFVRQDWGLWGAFSRLRILFLQLKPQLSLVRVFPNDWGGATLWTIISKFLGDFQATNHDHNLAPQAWRCSLGQNGWILLTQELQQGENSKKKSWKSNAGNSIINTKSKTEPKNSTMDLKGCYKAIVSRYMLALAYIESGWSSIYNVRRKSFTRSIL